MDPASSADLAGTAGATWLDARRAVCDMRVTEIPRPDAREWELRDGRIRHRGGGFFTVTGLRATRGMAPPLEIPVIDQPEIGILGFVLRSVGDGTEVLVQAKPEPGNVGLVQLAPSVQATESNYRRRHGGRSTPLLELFLGDPSVRPLADTLQSEQGTRFLGKYNRNATVIVDGDVLDDHHDALRWFPFAELQPLLSTDFAVNTDARSVLACTPWAALVGGTPFAGWRGCDGFGESLLDSHAAAPDGAATEAGAAMARLAALREELTFTSATLPLEQLAGWGVTDTGIAHASGSSFEIRHYRVTTSQREVETWDQPLVTVPGEGETILLCQRRDGVLRFLFCGRAEPGFRECVQFGPSTQDDALPGSLFPTLTTREAELRSAAGEGVVRLSSRHSDEGGRFSNCVARYSIVELAEDIRVPSPATAVWLSLAAVEYLLRHPGALTNEARTLVSMLLSLA